MKNNTKIHNINDRPQHIYDNIFKEDFGQFEPFKLNEW